MVIAYFKKEARHCNGRNKPCSIEEACSKVDTTKRNPWTRRYLRKKVRSELRGLCDEHMKIHRKVSAMITLPYWDKSSDEYRVTLPKASFQKYGISRHRLGDPGTYWTTYNGANQYAIKIQVLKTAGAQKQMHAKEELVYKMASNHSVGPTVYDWFYIKEKDGLSVIKPLSGRKVKFHSLAVAVVKRYDRQVNKRVRRMPSFDRRMERLEESLDRFSELHGIENREWTKDANLLVNLTEDDEDISAMIVGDWGKVSVRKGSVLRCDPKEKF
jgi:hypothetical protein